MPDALPFAEVAGDWLRHARRVADLSQRELAARAQVSRSVVSRIEAGRHSPRLDTVLALLHAAGLHLQPHDWLQASDDRQQAGSTPQPGGNRQPASPQRQSDRIQESDRSQQPDRKRQYDGNGGTPSEIGPRDQAADPRDRADRRFPAHLDARAVERFGDWWGDWPLLSTRAPSIWHRAARRRPSHTFDLSRRRRDERRRATARSDDRASPAR